MIAALLITLAQDPLLRWQFEPTEVDLGQPITCVLEVPHGPGAAPEPPELELDYGWAVTRGPDVHTIEGGTRLTWTVLALEPGVRELPVVDLALGDGTRLLVPPAAVEVRGALAGEEDSPQAMPDFRTVEERTSPVRPRHLLALTLALLALGTGGVIAWRRARRPRPEEEPSELERFEGLDRAVERSLAIELASLLRGAAEKRARINAPRGGLTDEEWLAALAEDDALDGDARAELGALLAVCSDIKFAGARPTRFAIDDLLARGEALLHAFEAPPPAEPVEEVPV